jgi:hypothetical protein
MPSTEKKPSNLNKPIELYIDTFSQQMEFPSSIHLNCLYIHCVRNVRPLELKSSSYFALRSILAELNYVHCDGRCKTDIETHRVYSPSPDILRGVEMQCNFVI